MNVLFWNTKGNSVESHLIEIIREKDCDIVLLAENNINIKSLCNTLSQFRYDFKPLPNNGGCKRINGIINKRYNSEVLQEHSRYQIFRINWGDYTVLLAAFHNISSTTPAIDEQKENCRCLHDDLKSIEYKLGIENSILVGDFNVNPFDDACIDACYLHAIPYAEQALKIERMVQGRSYKMFYNPMWYFLNNEKSPFGTYYYDNSGHHRNLFWNTFDQVLIRPSLIDAFDKNELTIIESIKNTKFVDAKGIPLKSISDHLPLFFNIREEKVV